MTEPNASPSSPSRFPFFYGYIIVAATFLSLVMSHGVRYSFGVFFKPMSTELGWTRAVTSGAFSLSWIVEGAVSLLVGHFNDRFGPRIVMSVLGFLAGMSYLLMSQTTSVWQLYLFYGVIGGAGNSTFVPLASTVARWFTRRRSLMTGLAITGIGIGSTIGPLVAGRMIQALDWRLSYALLGGTVMVIVITAAQFFKRDPAQIGLSSYGEETSRAKGAPAPRRGFTLSEALHTRQFWLFFGMMLCLGFSFFALQVHISPYVTDLGLPAATGAAVLATVGASSVIGRGVVGAIGDRIGNKWAFILGFIGMTLALVWLLASNGLWPIYLFATIFGMAYGNSATQESPLSAVLFGLTSHGIIFAAASVGFTLGAALGPWVAGYIFDVSQSYRSAIAISAGVAMLGFALNVLLPMPAPARHSELR